MIRPITSVLLLLMNPFLLPAQEKGTGMIFDIPSVRSIPYKAKLTAATYEKLPASASLEKYCPTAGDQGQYGTCVAFATGYHLRTILHAKMLETSGSKQTVQPNAHLFSPTFIYEKIKDEEDKDCQNGTNPVDAFKLMKNTGVARLATQPYSCGATIKPEAARESGSFKITDYQILFLPDEEDDELRINATKKALAEGYPCMLGFVVAKSFYTVKGDLWKEKNTDDGPSGKHGRHAMCVVGYDDKKYGGAFRVLNSWGTSWADKGLVWIPYKDFARYSLVVIQAYGPSPARPTPDKKQEDIIDVMLKGNVSFTTNMGEAMPASRISATRLVTSDGKAAAEDLVAYKMNRAYPSGTRFRFYINTGSESFIYAFASDLSGKVNKILPFADNMSPHIGANSTVAFPSEKKVVKLDDQPGTDYLLILYSKERLDAEQMLIEMNKLPGGLSQKIKKVLGNKLIPASQVNYKATEPGFDVKSGHTGTVVPLMVEIIHQ